MARAMSQSIDWQQGQELRGVVGEYRGSPELSTWENLRRMGVQGAVANNVAFMATPFLMPSIMARTGFWFGGLFMAYSAALTYSTGVILGEISALNPWLHTYPDVGEEAFRRLAADWCKASRATQRIAARAGRIFIQVVQFASYYLTGMAELIYLEQYLSELLVDSPLCQREWLYISALILWPATQIPTFKDSYYMAVMTVAIMCFNISIMGYQILLVQPWSCEPGPTYPSPTWSSTFNGITGIVYAFGGHGMYPEILREMQDMESWRSVMSWTYGIVVPIYFVLGMGGYYAYGGNAKANLNVNFPRNAANTTSIILQTVQELYYVISSMLIIVLQVELALGVDPTAWCSKDETRKLRSPQEHQPNSEDVRQTPQQQQPPERSGEEQGSTKQPGVEEGSTASARYGGCKEVLSGRTCGLPPFLFRLIFRSLFFGSQLLLCTYLLGGDGDVLLSLQSLAGSVGYCALTYYLPLLFGWVMLPRVSRPVLAYQAVSFVLLVLVMVFGIYSNVQDLIESAGGFGEEVACKLYPENFTGSGCEAALGVHEA